MNVAFFLLKRFLIFLRKSYNHALISARHTDAKIHSKAIISDVYSDLSLASNVYIGPFSLVYLASPPDSTIKTTLSIGKNTSIGEYNNIRATGKCRIGSNCLISQYVSLIGSNHKFEKDNLIAKQGWDEKRMGFLIGDDVWIGCHATILPGISIGNGVVIAAGSVVTKNLDDNGIYAGVPAKKIGERK